jgi:hypothetical protein
MCLQQTLLQYLYEQGPFTVGVFRTPPSVKHSRSLREKLDAGEDIGDLTIHSAASTLKVCVSLIF